MAADNAHHFSAVSKFRLGAIQPSQVRKSRKGTHLLYATDLYAIGAQAPPNATQLLLLPLSANPDSAPMYAVEFAAGLGYNGIRGQMGGLQPPGPALQVRLVTHSGRLQAYTETIFVKRMPLPGGSFCDKNNNFGLNVSQVDSSSVKVMVGACDSIFLDGFEGL